MSLVETISPHIIIRRSLVTGAPVRDRMRIVWRNSEQEIIAVEAGYSTRLRIQDGGLCFIVGGGIFWFTAIVLSLLVH